MPRITREQIEQLIASSQPDGGLARGPLLAASGAALIGLFVLLMPEKASNQNTLVWILPQLVMIGLMVPLLLQSRRERRQAALMVRGFEAVQLRRWPQAHEALTATLAQPIRHSRARAASLLALAAVAEAEQNYDASQRVYETVLAEEDGDPLQLHAARIALVAAMFRTGQLADAVSLSDRLTRAELRGPLKAQVELLSLFREVVMGQTKDNLDRAEERRELFRRYLGTRAAFGYGLLAAAFDSAGRAAEARRQWWNATLLVRPIELTQRFGELEDISRRYPAAEWPY